MRELTESSAVAIPLRRALPLQRHKNDEPAKVKCCTHLRERFLLGDVSILGRFLAGRLALILLAEADRPEGPLFLHL